MSIWKRFHENQIQFSWQFALNKILEIHNIIIVIRTVFEEDGKYYPQFFLDECLHEL